MKPSSRLIIKSLPKTMDDRHLRLFFESKGIVVTDCHVLTTKAGVSRMFAFLGVKNEDIAADIVKKFNGTFIGSSKVVIEYAAPKESEEIGRAWSRHTLGSSAHSRSHPEIEEAQQAAAKAQKKPVETSQKVTDKKLEEFLGVMSKRKGDRVWANEEVANKEESQQRDNKRAAEIGQKKARGEVLLSANDFKEKSKAFSDSEEEDINFSDDDDDANMDLVLNADDDMPSNVTRKVKESAEEEDPMAWLKKKSQPSAAIPSDDEDEKEESEEEDEQHPSDESIKQNEKNNETAISQDVLAGETGRLKLSNLPYSCEDESEVESFFRKSFGPVEYVHIVKHEVSKKSRGFAFIQFLFPEHAVVALSTAASKSGIIFQGRRLLVEAAEEKLSPAEMAAKAAGVSSVKTVGGLPLKEKQAATSSYKKQLEEKMKQRAGNVRTWNLLYVSANGVADAIAAQMGVSKSDLLDLDSEGLAVRIALGEASLLRDTKEWLASEGIRVDAFERVGGNLKTSELSEGEKKKGRSKNVMILKHLPPKVTDEDLKSLLAPCGAYQRLCVSPSRTLAIVQFAEENRAATAFQRLAFRKFLGVPLLVEWAPIDVFTTPVAATQPNAQAAAAAVESGKSTANKLEEEEEEEEENEKEENANGQGKGEGTDPEDKEKQTEDGKQTETDDIMIGDVSSVSLAEQKEQGEKPESAAEQETKKDELEKDGNNSNEENSEKKTKKKKPVEPIDLPETLIKKADFCTRLDSYGRNMLHALIDYTVTTTFAASRHYEEGLEELGEYEEVSRRLQSFHESRNSYAHANRYNDLSFKLSFNNRSEEEDSEEYQETFRSILQLFIVLAVNDRLKLLVEQDRFGMTPLMHAALLNHSIWIEALTFLVERGDSMLSLNQKTFLFSEVFMCRLGQTLPKRTSSSSDRKNRKNSSDQTQIEEDVHIGKREIEEVKLEVDTLTELPGASLLQLACTALAWSTATRIAQMIYAINSQVNYTSLASSHRQSAKVEEQLDQLRIASSSQILSLPKNGVNVPLGFVVSTLPVWVIKILSSYHILRIRKTDMTECTLKFLLKFLVRPQDTKAFQECIIENGPYRSYVEKEKKIGVFKRLISVFSASQKENMGEALININAIARDFNNQFMAALTAPMSMTDGQSMSYRGSGVGMKLNMLLKNKHYTNELEYHNIKVDELRKKEELENRRGVSVLGRNAQQENSVIASLVGSQLHLERMVHGQSRVSSLRDGSSRASSICQRSRIGGFKRKLDRMLDEDEMCQHDEMQVKVLSCLKEASAHHPLSSIVMNDGFVSRRQKSLNKKRRTEILNEKERASRTTNDQDEDDDDDILADVEDYDKVQMKTLSAKQQPQSSIENRTVAQQEQQTLDPQSKNMSVKAEPQQDDALCKKELSTTAMSEQNASNAADVVMDDTATVNPSELSVEPSSNANENKKATLMMSRTFRETSAFKRLEEKKKNKQDPSSAQTASNPLLKILNRTHSNPAVSIVLRS
eukprot:GDKJ01058604.1.p1 GENE.GDKJ01058604.1~~GDKJ01058604.1.p1  ORF type:complete len:1505 (+),score=476.46 GDKJ01058604.1:32-4516(+)